MIEHHWIGWEGEWFHWRLARYNSGNPYMSYRIGPLLIRDFKHFNKK